MNDTMLTVDEIYEQLFNQIPRMVVNEPRLETDDEYAERVRKLAEERVVQHNSRVMFRKDAKIHRAKKIKELEAEIERLKALDNED